MMASLCITVLFALAGLAKELGLVIPAGLAAWELAQGRWRRGLLLGVGSALPFVGWSLFLNATYGAAQNLVTPLFIPFAGLLYLTEPVSRFVVSLWVFFPVIAGGAWALLDLRKKSLRPGQGHPIFLLLANVTLIATLPQTTWPDPPAMFRTAILLAAYHPRLLPIAAVFWVPSGLLLAMVPNML